MAESLLVRARGLRVLYSDRSGLVEAVHAVSFELGHEKLGLVGSSGSGKSSVARALLGLLRSPSAVEADTLELFGEDILSCSDRRWNKLRGKDIAMVLQDSRYALNPVLPVGEQVGESLAIHARMKAAERRERVLEMLSSVGLSDPAGVYASYPHELSGGMGQRVMLAAALIDGPRLLVADEPTSALDAAIREQVLDLMGRLVEERRMGLILISHDLEQVARHCDRVIVMKDGRFVDEGRASDFSRPQNPYTKVLWTCRPKVSTFGTLLPTADRPESSPLERFSPALDGERVQALVAHGLCVSFVRGKREVGALDHVSVTVREGETLGIHGPSGCGKTTLLRVLGGIEHSWSGSLSILGESVQPGTAFSQSLRREVQLIFQDPYASLHPRHRVGRILGEILRVAGIEDVDERVAAALEEVELSPNIAERYAHQLSGGQRQRIVIARALLFRPRLILADEPSSALDTLTQAGILNLLSSIKAANGATLVLVSHDLDVLEHMSDRILTMENGKNRGEFERGDIDRGLLHSGI
jgi:peptide/nickel transport system ATP-binding protein